MEHNFDIVSMNSSKKYFVYFASCVISMLCAFLQMNHASRALTYMMEALPRSIFNARQ